MTLIEIASSLRQALNTYDTSVITGYMFIAEVRSLLLDIDAEIARGQVFARERDHYPGRHDAPVTTEPHPADVHERPEDEPHFGYW
jgi:hypothetical protein